MSLEFGPESFGFLIGYISQARTIGDEKGISDENKIGGFLTVIRNSELMKPLIPLPEIEKKNEFLIPTPVSIDEEMLLSDYKNDKWSTIVCYMFRINWIYQMY